MGWAPWSAEWTRKNDLSHIVFDDTLVYVDQHHPSGFTRKWFVRVGFGPRIVWVPVLAQSFLTTPTGALQTTTAGVDKTWNNSNNKVEVLGGGGAGAIGASTTTGGGGGAGGGYNSITNFSIATPGTTTIQWQVGIGGVWTASSITSGGDTWWNAAAFPTTGTAVGAKGGPSPATFNTATGGTAALTSAFFPTTSPPARAAGGGAAGTSASAGGGGGGSGGPNGAGTAGSGTAGGAADGSTVTGGAAGNPGTSFSGTEFDTTHGCGSGGGGSNASGGKGGPGGTYGGGSGGGSRTTGTGNNGGQGLIVLTWVPAFIIQPVLPPHRLRPEFKPVPY